MIDESQDKVYVVLIRATPVVGSAMSAAMYQGYGESWIKGYLHTKMPAGSPIEIRSVHEASA